VSDVLYADWHNSKVGISFCLGADGDLSAGYLTHPDCASLVDPLCCAKGRKY